MNTVNINRLLRRLEVAISKGRHQEAAQLAHNLAEMRLSCSVTRNRNENFTIQNILPAAQPHENDKSQSNVNPDVSEKETNNMTIQEDSSVSMPLIETNKIPNELSNDASDLIIRQTKVDAGRREVKSDNVSRLLDEENQMNLDDAEGEEFK